MKKCRCCSRRAQKGRTVCRPCRHKREKELDLVAWSYRTRKANAKRRGKAWSLTLEEFRAFCYETELLTNSGTKSTSYTVDRIRNEYGYHIGNIQRMDMGDNSKKQNVLNYDYSTGSVTVKPALNIDPSEYPF